jgi:hypothetical protein
MEPTIVLSPLSVALADAMARKRHFHTITDAGLLCRICSELLPTAEAWAKDDGACPGYVQRGQEPAMLPSQPLSVGPAEGGRG